jgi:hypothetical protein
LISERRGASLLLSQISNGTTLDNPGLPSPLWTVLDNKLWHATGAKGFAGIVSDREIKVLRERYKNSLCKMLDGVSLMDFGFSAVHSPYQFDNWRGWFGRQQKSRVAVWLEIDRQAVAHAFINAGAALARAHQLWRDKCSCQIIPGIEACHKGSIPLASVSGALLIDSHNLEVFEWLEMTSANTAEIARFESGLPPLPLEHESELLKAIRESMQ